MSNNHEDRKFLRSAPDPLEYALIDYQNGKGDLFSPAQVALIEEENAMGGCGLIFHKYKNIKVPKSGDKVTIKLGHIDPLFAECVYFKEINEHIIKAGFKFLE